MDLIFANAKMEDIGVLLDYNFDLSFGDSENNFQLSTNKKINHCKDGCFLYLENTEYGGIIDKIKVQTSSNEILYLGRTWHGILANKIIEPDTGEDYLVVSGEANSIIKNLIARLDLSDLFIASNEASGLKIDSFQFDRYIDAFSGIRKMLRTAKGKLNFRFKNGKVILSALPIIDYSQNEQFDTDQVALDIEKKYTKINHLICLGKGDLKERQVIHLYADNDGNIGKAQSIKGINEMTAVYDYSSVESLEELEKGGIEKLQELNANGNVNISFNTEDIIYDLDDVVSNKEILTGIEVTAPIVQKIVTIDKMRINIEYKIGE